MMSDTETIRSYQLILASNSPRRRQLMSLGGWDYIIQPAEINEDPHEGEDPRQYVERMAISKAQAVAGQAPPGAVVIGADTTVVHRNEQSQEEVLGKPGSDEEALQMLRQLRDKTHQVYTAIALVRTDDGKLLTGLCTTDVTMRRYSDEEIQAYIASGDPFDKAGAYAIQHDTFDPAETVVGCYPNVVGLPLCYLTRLLAELGVAPASTITRHCSLESQSPCLVYQKVLHEG